MKIASIGIDIGKTTFHLVALDEHGSIVIRRKFSRKALLAYSAKLTTSLIGMEACGGAHCLARLLRDQGHQPLIGVERGRPTPSLHEERAEFIRSP
jgi:transposase